MFNPDLIAQFPVLPGVYIMKRKGGEVLYVGKAKSLRLRVRQYFDKGGDGRHIIPYLIRQVDEIETIIVKSEKEALLLENTLIKKHKPRYNALLKDDKTYIALKVTTKHPWPRVEVVRLRGKAKKDGLYFGPYTSAFAARQTLEILESLFPLRQCSDAEFLRRTRPCILYEMKKCIAPCVGLCTKEEYQYYVDSTIKFLRGQNDQVLKVLQVEMEKASDALEFEKAQAILLTMKQIEKTLETQKVVKPRGGDFDALAIFRQGDEVVLCELNVREGSLLSVLNHNFSKIVEDDDELYSRFILEHYQDREDNPSEVFVPLDITSKSALEEVVKVDVVRPLKGEKKEFVEMARVNAENAFKKLKDEAEIREKALLELQDKLRLSRYPERIECFDNSNLSGSEPVSALVAFEEGKRDKNRTRKYKIRTADLSDDYGMMKEVLERRLRKTEDEFPDLLIVDGGKGHLNIALAVLKELDIATIDVIGVAKEEGRHDRGLTQEQIFVPNTKDPILFKPHSAALLLLQRIRDEAHRVAISFQKKRRAKVLIKSLLDDISGIGPAKRKKLLTHFGSVEKIAQATKAELEEIVSSRDAETIIKFFAGS
jgi:excinuclease ABC subunit C